MEPDKKDRAQAVYLNLTSPAEAIPAASCSPGGPAQVGRPPIRLTADVTGKHQGFIIRQMEEIGNSLRGQRVAHQPPRLPGGESQPWRARRWLGQLLYDRRKLRSRKRLQRHRLDISLGA